MAPTRVIVPATPDGLHPSVLPAILRQGYRAEVVPMRHVEAYFDLVSEVWEDGETFAIVEQDVELVGGFVKSSYNDTDLAGGELRLFDACPQRWCAHSYEVFAGDVATAYGGPFALGCTRFRAELLAERPDVPGLAGELDLHPVHPPRSYAVMDSTLTQILRAFSIPACQHFPNVVHHHHYIREGTIYG